MGLVYPIKACCSYGLWRSAVVGDFSQTSASLERSHGDVGKAFWNFQTADGGAVGESTFTKGGEGGRQDNAARQLLASAECGGTECLQCAGQAEGFVQTGTSFESRCSYDGYFASQVKFAFRFGASGKDGILYVLQAVGKFHSCKRRTI